MADNNRGNVFTFVASLLLMSGIGIMLYKRTPHLGDEIIGRCLPGPVT